MSLSEIRRIVYLGRGYESYLVDVPIPAGLWKKACKRKPKQDGEKVVLGNHERSCCLSNRGGGCIYNAYDAILSSYPVTPNPIGGLTRLANRLIITRIGR